MNKYLISYVASPVRGNATYFGNEVLMIDSDEITEEDVAEIKSCIAMKLKLVAVTITNVMRLKA